MKHKPLFLPNDYRKVVTLAQLEELTGIKRSVLRRWLKAGMIPGAFHPGKRKQWHFNREALEDWWKKMQNQDHS
jgi:excisionase family DNA binding protein